MSVPTDCPNRDERRGWMGDAQASSDEACTNFDMQSFYEEFLSKIRDDQERFNANFPEDTGGLADVVPYDGVGGNPAFGVRDDTLTAPRKPGHGACPVWQVAYIVIARQMWKHYGEDAIPVLTRHYPGLQQLMAYFDRHAAADGLLLSKCYGDWVSGLQ